MDNIKFIATDVDGTIVKDGTRDINPEYFQVFSDLTDMGVQVVIASGRQLPSIMRLMEPVTDRLWYIAEGGGICRCNGETHVLGAIPRNFVAELMEDIATVPESDVMLACPDASYAPSAESEMYKWIKCGYGYDILPMYGVLPPHEIVKVAMYHPTDAPGAFPESLKEKWAPRMHMTAAGKEWLDFTMPGVDKGAAIRRLIDAAGVKKEDVMVFGDNQNDVEMFRAAGISCAVENASEAVRAAADRVIPPYWEDGVLQTLKKLAYTFS